MIKKSRNFGTLTICIMLTASFINLASADNFPPLWLKKDAYVQYTTNKVGYAYVVNRSASLGFDTLSFWNATFGWHCTSINDTMARLLFTFSYVGKELNNVSLTNATLQLTGEVYVGLYNRAVYDLEGHLLGTTHLWVTANPAEGQEVVIWDVPPDKISLQAECKDIWFLTIQGNQAGFALDGTGKINGTSTSFLLLCDQDTGLMIDGNFGWDPIITSAGINALLLNGRIMFSDTNISLGPTYDPTNWSLIIMFTTLPILAFIVLFVAFYKRMRKKRQVFSTRIHFYFIISRGVLVYNLYLKFKS